jgi:hypothetical protein
MIEVSSIFALACHVLAAGGGSHESINTVTYTSSASDTAIASICPLIPYFLVVCRNDLSLLFVVEDTVPEHPSTKHAFQEEMSSSANVILLHGSS